jgi:ABC-type molybdate transport system substrate-binding protein
VKVKKAIAALTFVLAACSGDDDGGGGAGGTTRPRDPNTVTIVAGDTLQTSVQHIVDDFKDDNAGAEVDVSFVGQSDMQDTFTADDPPNLVIYPDAWMQEVPDGVEAAPLGRNLAVIVVPPGNPGQITDLSAFADDSGKRVQACGPDTQFGNFIALVLTNAGVTPADDTVGADCGSDAADKVAAGDLDAAVVFRTEVGDRDDVELVDVPEDVNLVFPISYAVLAPSAKTDALVQFMESADGQATRTAAGLLP